VCAIRLNLKPISSSIERKSDKKWKYLSSPQHSKCLSGAVATLEIQAGIAAAAAAAVCES